MMCALDYAGVQQSVCKDAGGCRTVRQASAAEFRPATCEQQHQCAELSTFCREQDTL